MTDEIDVDPIDRGPVDGQDWMDQELEVSIRADRRTLMACFGVTSAGTFVVDKDPRPTADFMKGAAGELLDQLTSKALPREDVDKEDWRRFSVIEFDEWSELLQVDVQEVGEE